MKRSSRKFALNIVPVPWCLKSNSAKLKYWDANFLSSSFPLFWQLIDSRDWGAFTLTDIVDFSYWVLRRIIPLRLFRVMLFSIQMTVRIWFISSLRQSKKYTEMSEVLKLPIGMLLSICICIISVCIESFVFNISYTLG